MRAAPNTFWPVGSPKLVECWQQLPGHLAALNKIAAVARQFGPRVGNFPLITEFANSDNYRLEDAAIWCADGNLEADSAAFRRPGVQPRQSPLFNVPLALAHAWPGAREVQGVGSSAVGAAAQRTHAGLDR